MNTQQDKELNPQESLALITEMLQKAKASQYHESGVGAIMWGCVIAICGIVSFLQIQLNVKLPFDIWLLAFVALVPQVFISIKEGKQRVVKTDAQKSLDAVWTVYGISIFMLVFYNNSIGSSTEQLLKSENIEFLSKNLQTGEVKHLRPFVPSVGSLFLLLYGVPTLATGLSRSFKPMIIGAFICYSMFIVSCFTATKYDFLMNGLAAIFNWLIPGIILYKAFKKKKALR